MSKKKSTCDYCGEPIKTAIENTYCLECVGELKDNWSISVQKKMKLKKLYEIINRAVSEQSYRTMPSFTLLEIGLLANGEIATAASLFRLRTHRGLLDFKREAEKLGYKINKEDAE